LRISASRRRRPPEARSTRGLPLRLGAGSWPGPARVRAGEGFCAVDERPGQVGQAAVAGPGAVAEQGEGLVHIAHPLRNSRQVRPARVSGRCLTPGRPSPGLGRAQPQAPHADVTDQAGHASITSIRAGAQPDKCRRGAELPRSKRPAAKSTEDAARDRGKFKPLPWTSAADRVRHRLRPPRCREHVMLGFSQITRPRVPVAISAPGGGTGDGRDRTAARALVAGHSPWSSGKPDDHPHPV